MKKLVIGAVAAALISSGAQAADKKIGATYQVSNSLLSL